jgi:hypothetical protein
MTFFSGGGTAARRRSVRSPGRPALLTAALVAAALAAPAAGPATQVMAATAAPAGLPGGCIYRQITGGYQWVCSSTSTGGGGQGSGGGGAARPACTLTPLTQPEAALLGLPAPPAGQVWDMVSCGGPQPFVGTMLVATGTPGGAPAVTPQQLAQIAVGDLIIPGPDPGTAPPAGKDGLVGLPEWFWVPPADWHPVQTARVQAGPVWAIATATPEMIEFSPGDGHKAVQCQGPGMQYNPQLPPTAQHTDCSYTYQQPSAGQPGNVYAAAVTVLWNVSWVGSGGTGGTVATGRPMATPLALPVAAGEAVVTGR